jgi:glyoxalase family protein
MELTGLHHISALTAHAAENLDFYTRILGMRLVKKTVNQDDTTSYHLFYGDEAGNAGTELTFFDIPHAGPNRPGVGSISRITLRVPDRAALDYWQQRLAEYGVEHDPIVEEGGRAVLTFRDPEGQRLALVDDSGAAVPGGTPWAQSTTPGAVAIRGLGAVTLTVRRLDATARVLTEVLGFRAAGSYAAPTDPARQVQVFATGAGGPGAEIHVEERKDLSMEFQGAGGVHHVALRVPDTAQHRAWLARLGEFMVRNSGVIDRFYFQSIYFRDPNGILFELATDGPGFLTDESPEHLGEGLSLPPFLEPRRAQNEAHLRPLEPAQV